MATWLSAELSLVYSRLPVSELVGSFQRSSYSCRFFVLPCCFFDFVGRHCRRQSGKTQYRGYLDFISEVGSACGFRVEEDCLRIPSTRRVRPAPARPAGGAGALGGGWRRAVSQSRTALALESTRVPDGARAGFSLRPRGSEGFSLYGAPPLPRDVPSLPSLGGFVGTFTKASLAFQKRRGPGPSPEAVSA